MVLRYTVPGRPQVLDSKRRDVGVVDRARLESEAGQRLQAIPTRLNTHAISGLTLANYRAVCVRKSQCSSRLGASRITVLSLSSRSLSACCRVRFSTRPAAFPPTISSSTAWNRLFAPIKFPGVGPSRQVPLISQSARAANATAVKRRPFLGQFAAGARVHSGQVVCKPYGPGLKPCPVR
jgi:hypothetical protein